MILNSAIFEGNIRHRRREPARDFSFPLFMVYLDLAEADRVLSMTRLWGRSRFCPARFVREDYLGPGEATLDEAVRTRVHAECGRRPSGPIRMLTHLRYFGYVFNPVTFYYCFDDAERVTAVVAEITNTPWGERHAYVLDVDRAARRADDRPMRWRFGKEFHVSPFLPMDLEYDWTFTEPRDELLVHMNVRDRSPETPKVFDATLRMTRKPITPGFLRMLLIRRPLMTARVIAKIHVEAFKLWLGGVPTHPHPASRRPPVATTPPTGDQR